MGQIMTYIVMLVGEIVFCCRMIQMSDGNQITGNAFVCRRSDHCCHRQHDKAEQDARQKRFLGRLIKDFSLYY